MADTCESLHGSFERLFMKTFNSRVAKRLVISLIGLGALSGCVAVPYNSGYYNQGYPGYYDQGYSAPVYTAPPAAYVAPAFSLGFGYRSGGYGHGYGGYRGGRW
jgi:hypothetical protein